MYITRLASKGKFSPSNKIQREVDRAKDLSAPLYWGDQMKRDGMNGAFRMYDKDRNTQGIWWRNVKEQFGLFEISWCKGNFTETELQEVTWLYLPPCRCKWTWQRKNRCNKIQRISRVAKEMLNISCWRGNQLVAETSTWQHTTLTTDRHPCPRWDSNPQFHQASGRRPTP